MLSARLNDARFFWDEDRKVGFDAWLEKLKGVTFHAKLGTMAERVERIAALAREIAPLVGADPDEADAGRPPGQGRPGLAAWSASSPSCRASWAATTPAPPA